MTSTGKLVVSGLIFLVAYFVCVNAVAFVIGFIRAFFLVATGQARPGDPTVVHQNPYFAAISVVLGIVLAALITRKLYRRWWLVERKMTP